MQVHVFLTELQVVVLEQGERGRVTSGASFFYWLSPWPRVCLEHPCRISKLKVFVPCGPSSVRSLVVLSRYEGCPQCTFQAGGLCLVLFVHWFSALGLDLCWWSVVDACSSLAWGSRRGATTLSSGNCGQSVVRSLWRLRGSVNRAGGRSQQSLLVTIG